MDRKKAVKNRNRQNEDYYTRVYYSKASSVAHVVGFHNSEYGRMGVEAFHIYYLMGYNNSLIRRYIRKLFWLRAGQRCSPYRGQKAAGIYKRFGQRTQEEGECGPSKPKPAKYLMVSYQHLINNIKNLKMIPLSTGHPGAFPQFYI